MDTKVELARAVFPFQATQSGDLSFDEDEIITVLKKNQNGWWLGQIGQRRGEFPFNYVEVIQPAELQALMMTQKATQNMNAMRGDSIKQIEMSPEPKSTKYSIKATLVSDAVVKGTKKISEFRSLDDLLRAIFKTFESTLPPMWADNAYFSEDSSMRRGRVLLSYLRKLQGNELTEFTLIQWLDPKFNFQVAPGIKAQVEQANRSVAAIARNSFRAAMQNAPALARVEFNWDPHDAVELQLRKGEVIAVLSRQTLSPGWWEGQTAEGLKGLFPYNHVAALSEVEAKSMVLGEFSDVLTAVAAPKQVKKEETKQKPSRARKIEKMFAIGSMESFDALLIDGFTMEKNGRMVTESARNPPGPGDRCTMAYVGFIWDCQEQSIVEFASSDLPDKQGKLGNLQFTINKGEVIRGIELAAGFMEKGQNVRIIVKPDLAYGDVGFPQLNIPPNVHLVYDLTLIDFEAAAPSQPMESKMMSYNAPQEEFYMEQQAEPRTLAEAVAMRARNIDMQQTNFNAPIQNRPGRGHGNQMKGYKTESVEVNMQSAVEERRGPPPKEKGPARQYDLMKLREIVRTKAFTDYGVSSAFLEEHLTDQAFAEAFHCDRSAFVLMPRWKQMKLKKDADLF